MKDVDLEYCHQAIAKHAAVQQARITEAVRAQQAAGRCAITPMPITPTKPFRTELFTESLPVFCSNVFQGNSRMWQREHTLETGEQVRDVLVIGRTSDTDDERGVLRQIHQECWYKVLWLWNRAGYPLLTDGTRSWGQLRMSAYELVTALWGDDKAERYARARQLLADLQSVPIRRERHYLARQEMDEAQFTLLMGVEWASRATNSKTHRPSSRGHSNVEILLSSFVTEWFLGQRVKALMLEPYMELAGKGRGQRSDIAPLLYPKLDRELAQKDEYHRKLAPLFEELGLASYRYKSKRREKILGAIAALNGKPIQHERYTLNVTLRESTDGSDYVLVARRSGQMEIFTS